MIRTLLAAVAAAAALTAVCAYDTHVYGIDVSTAVSMEQFECL